MKQDCSIRNYLPGDAEKIVELLENCFPNGWPSRRISCSPFDFWKWKHQDRVYKCSFVAICSKNKEVIGVNHHMPIRLKFFDEICNCALSGDNAVQRDFRNTGISKRLYELCHKDAGSSLKYWHTGNQYLVKSALEKQELFPPFKIKIMSRVRDINLYLRHSTHGALKIWRILVGFKLWQSFNHIKQQVKVGNQEETKGFYISNIKAFDDRIDLLCEEALKHHLFMVQRSRAYLNWRYLDPRAGNYTIRQITKAGQILGYVVLQIDEVEPGSPRGFITDLLTLPRRPDIIKALVSDSINYFDTRGINVISALVVAGHPIERALNENGFFTLKRRPGVFGRILDTAKFDNKKKLALEKVKPNRLHFCYGDLD
ncbi:MAG: GNAT family N-acetyltransferase [Deltaproteobacteria bacterium]|nr:GNAT family N-acetyltransferase [Deltaproteobacteria bacterium]